MSNLNLTNEQLPTVAVVTTTIGREELEQTILSVQNQTYPCQHYVFVDGKQYWDRVKHLEQKYPNVIFTFLPMNTGGRNHIGNGAIHAILPYLLQEDIFCFLDDDNWYEPNHIEYLATMIQKYQLDYAYSLRNIYTRDGDFLCQDNLESLGFWHVSFSGEMMIAEDKKMFYHNHGTQNLIDTNCYAICRNVAFELTRDWYSGVLNDRNVFKKLLELNARGGMTAKYTINYRLNLKISRAPGSEPVPEEYLWKMFKYKSEEMAINPEQPWFKPTLLIDRQFVLVDDFDK